MSSEHNFGYRTNLTEINKFKLLVIVAFIILQLSISSISPTSAYIDYNENNVDSDSDIDLTSNYGTDGSTSYIDAQSFGGNAQSIVEENTGTGKTSDWKYYKTLTINHSQVVEDLNNFPVLISLTDNDLKSRAQVDGDDIAFFDSGGNQLDHEIEVYNPNYSGNQAKLIAWVKSNLSSSVDTAITMKYGNSTMSSQEAPEAVWDTNFRGVWHLNNDPSSGSPQILDSTINNNDGTSLGTMNSDDLINSKIGYGIDFDGIDDGIDIGNDPSIQLTGAITVETWFNVRFIGNDYLVTKNGKTGDRGWDLSFDDNPSLSPDGLSMFRYSVGGSLENPTGNITTYVNTWYHIVGVYNPSTYTRFYLNGVLLDENTTNIPSSMYDSTANMMIGQRSQSASAYNGTMDEVRLSNIARSSGYVETEYNNVNDPSSFYTVGPQYEENEYHGWSYYKVITIDHNKVSTDLTDFPILISLFDEDLKIYAQADGDDIAFFDNNGTQLAHEIEKYDPSYNSTHAELIAWVKSDLSGTVDTTITMKYGDSTISSQENPTLVWNSNFMGVWHLKEDPSGTAPQMLDSTGSNDGTSVGTMTSTDQIEGQIDGSIDFDGSDDYIDMGSSINIASSSFTVSTWAKRGSTTDADIIFQQGSSGPNTGFHVGFRSSNVFTCAFWADDLDTGATYTDSEWHLWSCTYDSSTKSRIIYRDGVSVASDTASNHFIGSGSFYLGLDGMVNEGYSGQLDESRLLSVVLSSQWLQTEFNNQNDTDSFYSVSSQYQFTGNDWSYYKEITIDSSKVASDLTNFPVLISIYDEDLKASAQLDGDDIAFFGIGGNQLAHEIESYDPTFNGTHARLSAWVKTDLSGSTDTTIIMKYGNPDLTSQENPSLVWSSDYNSVWHLNEDPAGTSPQMLDSTLYVNDGTTANSPSQITGKIENGLGFDDSNERSVDVSDSSSLQLSSAVVVSAWVKTIDSDSDVGIVVNKWGSDPADRNYWFGKLDGSTFAFYVDNTQNVQIALTNINDGGWHYVVGVADASTIKLYVDGSEINSASYTGSSRTGSSSLAIGHGSGEIAQEWNGDIDEVRIASSLKSTNWILTEFNNQNDPDTFYSIGEEKDLTPVIVKESVSVGATSGDTLVSPSITGVDGDLYLAVISTKIYRDTISVSGLGLTWTEIADQPAGRSQTAISVWWAQGIASTGSVTATVSSAVTDSLTMQVHRITGVDSSNPIGNYSSSNTNGVNGSGTGGTDDTLPTLDLTTTTSNSMVFGAVAIRSRILTPGAGYDLVSTSYAGSGGSASGIATEQKGKAVPGLVVINGTLDTTSDWALIGIEIKPKVADPTVNYQLEWEHQVTGVDTSKEIYELAIYGSSSETEESFEIQMWNTTSSSWTNPLNIKIESTEQWYNNTISGTGIIGSTITWRYRGDTEVNDLIQSTLTIDYAAIVSYHMNPIFVSTPSDLQYNEGSTGNTLIWNSTDTNPDIYRIYKNGSQIDTGSWTNTGEVIVDVDGLTKGVYNYTIEVTDSYGNQITDMVWVTVIDITNPTFVTVPNDTQYNEGSTGNTLNWNSTDLHPDTYILYRNGTQIDSNIWTNASEITSNIDGLSKGVYNFTIIVFDTSGNQVSNTVWLTVVDTTDPQFVTLPNDVQYNEDTTGNTLSWNSTDLHPGTYTIFQNTTDITGSLPWNNTSEITVNIDGLAKAVYNYTIIIFDTSGNSIVDTVFVTVVDQNPPSLSSPSDIQYVEGAINNKIVWNAADNYPDRLTIYRNGTVIASYPWASGNIENYVDGLAAGVYNFTIVVWDKSNNLASDTVFVTVIDNVNPTINSPSDILYSEGSTGHTINWIGSDLHPDTYIIYQNSSQVDTDIWSSAISFNIDGLVKGVYNFTIIIYDGSNNSANDTVIVTVVDTTNPTIDHPSNILYAFGTTGNTINWTASDNYPDNFIIYQNGSQVDSGSWTSGIEIVINIDGHVNGNYNYTIVVTDLSGNSVKDTVIVTVVDATTLSVSSPSDIQYSEGSIGNVIEWTGVDDQPDNYSIYQNGSQVETGNWNSGVKIIYNIDGLTKGSYNFTIIIADTSFNTVSDTVIVVVIDTTSPTFDTSPSDLQYAEGQISNILIWNTTDLYPATYVIYQNGSEVDSGSWDNATTIMINIDGLLKGTYNYTIVVIDMSNNIGRDVVIVTVIDSTLPIFTSVADDAVMIEGSVGNTLNWTATDSYEGNYLILQNGTLVDTNSWSSGIPIYYTIDGLQKGAYNLTIVILDSSGNSIYDEVIVIVIDLTAPNLSSPADLQYNEGTAGHQIIWNLNDNYPDTWTIYKNGTQLFSGSWTSGDLNINVDGLAKGFYNYTIVVYDKSANSAADTVIVIVIDNTNPLLSAPSDLVYSEGTTGNTIEWIGNDLHPNNYFIYQNGSLVSTNAWSSGIQISYNIDNLMKGLYNYTIIVFDDSGNWNIDTVIVQVDDTSAPTINTPTDIQYYQGETGNIIPWIIMDNYSGNFTIYQNGTEVQAGTWVSGIPLDYNIDGLTQGNYNFTIIAFDQSDNFISDSVFVRIIVDTTSPMMTSGTNNYEMIVATSNNILTWVATDENPGIYEIYQDEVLISSSVWDNGETISLNIDTLKIGIYNITIIIYDTSTNKLIAETMVSVTYIRTNMPQIMYSPIVYEGYTDVITGIWTDKDENLIPSGSLKGSLNNTQLASSTIVDGTFFISVDYSSLESGTYTLTLKFEKLSYENRTVIVQITVLKHKLDIDVTFDNQLTPGEEFTISIRITYGDPEINNNLDLNELGAKSGVYQGAEIAASIILEYEDGEFDTLVFNGESDNSGFFYINLSSEQTHGLKAISSLSVDLASGINTEGQSINFDANEIDQFVDISTPSTESSPNTIIDPLILIGIIVALAFLVIILVMRRRTQEKYDKIQTTKKDILLRLSEMYSIRSIVIMEHQDGSLLLEYVFKSDKVIENAVKQLLSTYRIKKSVSKAGTYTSGSIKRTIDDIQKYDFVNLYYNRGSLLDIFVFTSGKITQTDKSIQFFDEWLFTKYNLEKKGNLQKLFDDKKEEILHGMHIQFDTWTMFKLKSSSNLDIKKLSSDTEVDVVNLIVEKENVSFTEIVGKLNEKHKVGEIYNCIRDLLIQLKLEVTI